MHCRQVTARGDAPFRLLYTYAAFGSAAHHHSYWVIIVIMLVCRLFFFVCITLRAHQKQRLGKEAAEAAGLRERSRELAVETKRLAKEAEARQGRLEEARERGATAEEALRASKVWMGRWGIFWLMLHSIAGCLIAGGFSPLHAGFFSWPRRGLLFFASKERKTRRDPHVEECGRARPVGCKRGFTRSLPACDGACRQMLVALVLPSEFPRTVCFPGRRHSRETSQSKLRCVGEQVPSSVSQVVV